MKWKLSDVIQVVRYLIGYCFLYPYLLGLVIDPEWCSSTMSIVIVSGMYIIYFIVTIMLSLDTLKHAFDKFLEAPFKLLLKMIPLRIGMILVVSFLSTLVTFVAGDVSPLNQESVTEGILALPLMYIPLATIFAPIVEEVVFREILYKKVNHRYLGILLSCGIFGLLHCLEGLMAGNWIELLFVIVYGIQAYFLIMAYDETDSMAGSMVLHFLNNLLGCIVVFL